MTQRRLSFIISYLIVIAFPALAAPIQSIRLVTPNDKPLPKARELDRTLQTHLTKEVTEDELGALADLVVDHLHRHHWPVSLVTVWDEDDGLAQGRVTLQVQQGRIGDIAVLGGTPRRQLAVAQKIADLRGAPLDALALQRRLDALAFSSWLAVTPQVVPGATLDTANLALTLQDVSPISAFASYENNGVEPLGENRYTLGFEWLNAFALGHDLSFATSIADDPETLTVLAGSYRALLPWRHELRLGGYYAESSSIAEVLGIPLNVEGTTWAASARYIVPWRVSEKWRSEWQLGFDYKQFDNQFTFGSLSSAPETAGVGTLVLGTQWSYDKDHNHARFALEASHGHEGWAKGQTEHTYEDLRPGASPTFTTLRFDSHWLHDFENKAQTLVRLGAQWSDGPVLASEQLALASVNAVRGYPERSIRADRGAWLSLEARTPAWKGLRAIAFTDAAYIADDVSEQDFLASAGLGIRGEITKHFQLRAELAFPLVDGDEPRVHLAAVMRF